MKIINHLLVPESGENIKINLSPFAGVTINPSFLIIHYTATDNASSPISWFKDTKGNTSKIAAHIVLGKDGAITQMIPFDKKANHAGSSNWDGKDGMNTFGIGIEVVNAGQVSKTFPAKTNSVIKISHKHNPPGVGAGEYWFNYPQVQLDALYKLSRAILSAYPNIKSTLGHDDVSPYRKTDPGPAFSWDAFKKAVYGSSNNIGKVFTVNTAGTNFRKVPSTQDNDPIKPLPIGYQVGLIGIDGEWSKVYLVNARADVIVKNSDPAKCYKQIGWIKSSLLTLKPGQS